MFLEEQLENVYRQNKGCKENFGVALSLKIDLLNVCIAHIDEHLKPKDTWLNVFRIIKQTDGIWRSFAKKKGFSENFFRANYIIPRLKNVPSAKDYFKITKGEIEKYGQK